LLKGWEKRLPEDTPNRFIINIQQNQLLSMQEFFKERGMQPPLTYPMVRGRLVAINNKQITPDAYEDERTQHLVEREFNLSWAESLREDNEVIAGRWWSERQHGQPLFSVEEGIAKAMGVKLGDRLTYAIAGEEFSGEITNLRKVQWDTFQANFFVLTPPDTLDSFPVSFITSFYLPDSKQEVLADLIARFPNFTLIDVSAIMNKVREIIQRVTDAVEYVFLFTLMAGLMVFYAAIQATHDERMRESAILRTLGAGRRQLVTGLVSEFVSLGMLAGLVAAIAASLIGFVVAEQVLKVPYSFNAWLWLSGLIGGGAGLGLAGYLGTRSILNSPPLLTLRKTDN
jgi:putative ABC transport system permease protein